MPEILDLLRVLRNKGEGHESRDGLKIMNKVDIKNHSIVLKSPIRRRSCISGDKR